MIVNHDRAVLRTLFLMLSMVVLFGSWSQFVKADIENYDLGNVDSIVLDSSFNNKTTFITGTYNGVSAVDMAVVRIKNGFDGKVILDEAKIDLAFKPGCAIILESGADVNLEIRGTNVIGSGYNTDYGYAGIEVPVGAKLHLEGEATANLTVTGGRSETSTSGGSGAAIGGHGGSNGNPGGNCGEIEISGSVRLVAYGGDGIDNGGGAGLGGGGGGSGSVEDSESNGGAGGAGGKIKITDSVHLTIYGGAGDGNGQGGAGAGLGGGGGGYGKKGNGKGGDGGEIKIKGSVQLDIFGGVGKYGGGGAGLGGGGGGGAVSTKCDGGAGGAGGVIEIGDSVQLTIYGGAGGASSSGGAGAGLGGGGGGAGGNKENSGGAGGAGGMIEISDRVQLVASGGVGRHGGGGAGLGGGGGGGFGDGTQDSFSKGGAGGAGEMIEISDWVQLVASGGTSAKCGGGAGLGGGGGGNGGVADNGIGGAAASINITTPGLRAYGGAADTRSGAAVGSGGSYDNPGMNVTDLKKLGFDAKVLNPVAVISDLYTTEGSIKLPDAKWLSFFEPNFELLTIPGWHVENDKSYGVGDTFTLAKDTVFYYDDFIFPRILAVTPSGSGVPLSGSISITFSKEMRNSTGVVSLTYDNRGETVLLSGGRWSAEGAINNSNYSIEYGNLPMREVPTEYTLELSGFTDLIGNSIPSATYKFITIYQQSRPKTGYIPPNTGGTVLSDSNQTVDNRPKITVGGIEIAISLQNSDRRAVVSLSGMQLDSIVASAGEEIIFDISATEGAENVFEVQINRHMLQQLAEAGQTITIRTAQGGFSLSSEMALAICNQAGVNISFCIEALAIDNLPSGIGTEQEAKLEELLALGWPIFEISILSGGKEIIEFEGVLQITLPYDGDFNDMLVAWLVETNGELSEMPGRNDASAGIVSFSPPHLSLFAIGYKEAAEAPAEPVKQPGQQESVELSIQEQTPDPSKAEAIVLTIDSLVVKQGDTVLPEPPVAPRIINDRTMLPFRYLIQTLLGGTVDWDVTERRITAELNGYTIEMTVGDELIAITSPISGGGDTAMSYAIIESYGIAPVIVDDHTLVPLRAFEVAGIGLVWDEANRTVSIQQNEK